MGFGLNGLTPALQNLAITFEGRTARSIPSFKKEATEAKLCNDSARIFLVEIVANSGTLGL